MKKLFSIVSPPTFHLAPRSLDLIDLLYSSVNINVQPVEVLTSGQLTGNPGSVIVPQYGSSKITVFVWGKNVILKFLGNTK